MKVSAFSLCLAKRGGSFPMALMLAAAVMGCSYAGAPAVGAPPPGGPPLVPPPHSPMVTSSASSSAAVRGYWGAMAVDADTAI